MSHCISKLHAVDICFYLFPNNIKRVMLLRLRIIQIKCVALVLKIVKFIGCLYEQSILKCVVVSSRGSGFGGLEVACWPLVPKFAASNPAEAVGFFRAKKKILSTPSFGREEKPFVPCRRFTACKRSPNVTW